MKLTTLPELQLPWRRVIPAREIQTSWLPLFAAVNCPKGPCPIPRIFQILQVVCYFRPSSEEGEVFGFWILLSIMCFWVPHLADILLFFAFSSICLCAFAYTMLLAMWVLNPLCLLRLNTILLFFSPKVCHLHFVTRF